MIEKDFVIAAFYQFADFHDFEAWRQLLKDVGEANEVRGSVLVAPEGINGTVAGPRQGVDTFLAFIRQDGRFSSMTHKESFADTQPFGRMRVRPKPEIVKLGIPEIDPTQEVGEYVEPPDWNELISDPDVFVIDTRNEFEVQIGSFKGAINPHTEAFNHFPEYVAENLDPQKHKKVAMFCTGGIRCEKATAYLLQQGFDEVFHLKGGILNYLKEVPESDSLWEGNCFVFDDRVTVNHQLEPHYIELCYACQTPITDEIRQSEKYRFGIYCPICVDSLTPEFIARAERKLKERAHQSAK
ncbi:MAG: rhodanese-related sulfurtransferase [Chloroflexota bacterium]